MFILFLLLIGFLFLFVYKGQLLKSIVTAVVIWIVGLILVAIGIFPFF